MESGHVRSADHRFVGQPLKVNSPHGALRQDIRKRKQGVGQVLQKGQKEGP